MTLDRSRSSDLGADAAWSAIASVQIVDCPWLRAALDELFALLRACDADPRPGLGAASASALARALPTVSAWLDAGWIDAGVVAGVIAADGAAGFLGRGGAASRWVDGWLAPDLLIGAAHLPRLRGQRRGPVASALAALVAVETHRGLVDATLQPEGFEPAGGCWLRPSIATDLVLGRFLASRVGDDAAIAAAAGAIPPEALIDGDDAAEWEAMRTGVAVSAHHRRDGDLDETAVVWFEDALLLFTHRPVARDGRRTAAIVAPPGHRLRVDLGAARLIAPDRLPGAEVGGCPLPASLALPGGPCARAARAGWHTIDIAIGDEPSFDDLVGALIDLVDNPPRGSAADITGDGFELSLR